MDILGNFWFIQSIGAIALVFVVLAWNATTRRNILLLQSVNLVFFILHYGLLSAYAGAAMCLVTLLRNIVFMQRDQKAWARHSGWFFIFTILSVGVLTIFWQGWITVLPVAGVVLGMHAISQEKPARIRSFMLIASIIWIPYTLVVGSYSGLASQLVGIAGLLMGMYRHDRKNIFSET